MPLVRYELRCEHSLANPELFRSAARDDPEGLLEGVAMAGLVGIVRQLGDLAEFAAELFSDLHAELTAVGGRAHDLTVRVQQLEADLPAVEKALLSEPNQLRFAYTNGADWHASIRSDQNHCTSGELPRFIRNYYEECRGPPRLFLLDRFDVAGAGACLKRYSDPSFFKLEWARTELMKAQRAQRDKKARRDKKRGRRRKTGQPIAAINQIPARVRYGSASLEDLDSLSHLLAPTLKNEVGSSSSNRGANHGQATQTQRRSNLGPQKKVVEGPSSPSGVSAPQAEGGASKSVNVSAKDIEANVSGKFYQPSDTENVAESMAGKISKIIEMEDREAVPPVGLIPRNVDNKSPKSADGLKRSDSVVEAIGSRRVTGEDLEAASMGRIGSTSRGTPRGNDSTDGRERSNIGNLGASQSSMPDVSPRGNASLASKGGVTTSESRIPSRRVPGDVGVPISQANSSRISSVDIRDTVQLSGNTSRGSSVDAKEAHVIAARFSRLNPESSSRAENDSGDATVISTSGDLSGVKQMAENVATTSEAEDRHEGSHHSSAFAPTANQLLPSHNYIANMPEVEQRKHCIAEAPAGDGAASSTGDGSEDFHLLKVQRRANKAVDTNEVSNDLEETIHKPSHLPPVRIEELFASEEESRMISATSPKISSQWSSPREDDLRTSLSMLSRRSYSSELMPVSSGSEPESPVSPRPPTFNALYSPPGSPSRISGVSNESPPGLHTGSYLRTAHHSNYSSPRSEIPVLSLSPRSRLTSPFSVSWADQGDNAGPSRPPPPLPENPSHLESRQEVSLVESQLYPLPSPPPDPELNLLTSLETGGLPSQSIEGRSHLTSPQENAEKVHAEPASRRSDKSEPLHAGDHIEVPFGHIEKMQPSATSLEAEVRPPSTTSSSATVLPTSPLTSPFGLADSATLQPTHKGFDNLDPRHTTESISLDVPSNGPTSITGLLDSPVGELEADSSPALTQGPTPDPATTEVFVHPTPRLLNQPINLGPSFSMRGEESVPSSPTGTVIIKDSPSPPASPASNYSDSESEILEYHQPRSPRSSRSIAHGLEDAINYEETGGCDIGLHQELRFESSESGPTAIVSVQKSGMTNSASENLVHAAHSPPEDEEKASASDTSAHLDISHDASPFSISHLDSGIASALNSSEAASRRPIPMTTPAPISLNNSASSSLPDNPLDEEFIAGEDEASTLQWTGRSRPDSPSRTEIRLSSASSSRSASNSPLTSPRNFLDHASSLKWRGRSDRASFKPDFSLPPNLVCRSETSSPPCSPPLPSDLDSPKEWDEVSEISNSSKSSSLSQQVREEAANVGVYRLPDSPLPPDSPRVSDEGDRLPGPSSGLNSDDIALDHTHEMAETTTARSAIQHPPDSFSGELSFEGPSSATEISRDCHQPSDAQFRLSTFEPPTESVLPDSLSQLDNSQELPFESQTNPSSTTEAHEPPTLSLAPGSADTPTKDALAAATAHHDWNMMKALSFQDPSHRPLPPPDGENVLLEQIRTKSFNLRRVDSMEKKDPIIRPTANINVAAILEKANAIRQAFVGSDGEGDDEDDWNDS